MNYREKIRKAIECPQLNNTRYGEWGALNLEQRKYIKRLLDELDSADNYLKKVYLENKQLKDNWNKLKEYIEKDYDFYDKLIAPEYGCAVGALRRIKDKMQEIEERNNQ